LAEVKIRAPEFEGIAATTDHTGSEYFRLPGKSTVDLATFEAKAHYGLTKVNVACINKENISCRHFWPGPQLNFGIAIEESIGIGTPQVNVLATMESDW